MSGDPVLRIEARPSRFAARRAVLFLALGACLPRGSAPAEDAAADAEAPGITGLSFACDRRSGAWAVEVETDAWAGGATLFWTVDGAWVEQHGGFRSVRAAPDGSEDAWRLDLRIVDDFRPAGVGGVTAFTCNAPVSALVWVDDLAGEVADCRQVGPDPSALLADEASPPCPTVWVEPAP